MNIEIGQSIGENIASKINKVNELNTTLSGDSVNNTPKINNGRSLWEGSRHMINRDGANSISEYPYNPLIPIYQPNTKVIDRNQLISPLDNNKAIKDVNNIRTDAKESILGVFVNRDIKKNIEEFLQSKHGQYLLSQLPKLKDDPRLRGRFAGKFFEETAFRYRRDQMKPGGVLFSPQESLELWGNLYPDKKIDEHSGLNPSLIGVTVPDGLEIEDNPHYLRITKVFDYKDLEKRSSRIVYERILEQSRGYGINFFANELRFNIIAERMGRVVHELHPELPSKPLKLDPGFELIYVIPENSRINIPYTTINVPITHSKVRQLTESLLNEANIDRPFSGR